MKNAVRKDHNVDIEWELQDRIDAFKQEHGFLPSTSEIEDMKAEILGENDEFGADDLLDSDFDTNPSFRFEMFDE